jgi:hypothetical protein
MSHSLDLGALLAIVVVVAWAIQASAAQTRRWGELFDALAGEFGGQLGSDGLGTPGRGGLWSAAPVLLLPLRGTEYAGRMRFYSTGGKSATHYTEFTAPLSVAGWSLSVAPEGLLHKLGQLLGAQDVKSGDAAFDAAFSIRSSDEPQAADFVGRSDVQQALLALKGLAGNGHAALSVEGGKFRLLKLSWLQEREAAREFLDKSLRLYHAFPGAYPPGP